MHPALSSFYIVRDSRGEKKMDKVLLLNGSPHQFGCTHTALREVSDAIEDSGLQTEILHVGAVNIPGCKACGYCSRNRPMHHGRRPGEYGNREAARLLRSGGRFSGILRRPFRGDCVPSGTGILRLRFRLPKRKTGGCHRILSAFRHNGHFRPFE